MMAFFIGLFTVILILDCVILVFLVLIQLPKKEAGAGLAFGAGTTVKNGGASDGGTSQLGGYSIINAESLTDAASKAKGCPVLKSGGSVEVYEALVM